MNEQVKIKLLKVDGSEHDLWTLAGKKLWDSLADSGMDIGGSCGGNGLCGKCKLRVEGEVRAHQRSGD
jgi:Na+-transporting NADH:ubiquinone oxidoreductase subunit NqrF